MRRRDFAIGMLLATANQSVRAQGRAKQRRIAIIVSTSPVASISDTGIRAWQAFFAELRHLGDVEGQNLTVERYSGAGRPAGFARIDHPRDRAFQGFWEKLRRLLSGRSGNGW